ncbi:hypothetical protein IMCC3135_20390 [Granulosicoccus antarcticus IMCC3135]|uniref:Uncharacterized protein n=1 Tax=Granulosicoccus antarcticus IMCC3135 TaxID=1192854 RepID=A0A2Z2NUH8_9GAMM|nr:hypothetical protein IMCC3135_20390 [Granulosicoccus antarcticus IMCC3135]
MYTQHDSKSCIAPFFRAGFGSIEVQGPTREQASIESLSFHRQAQKISHNDSRSELCENLFIRRHLLHDIPMLYQNIVSYPKQVNNG